MLGTNADSVFVLVVGQFQSRELSDTGRRIQVSEGKWREIFYRLFSFLCSFSIQFPCIESRAAFAFK